MRGAIGPIQPFLTHLLIAAVIFFSLYWLVKDSDMYIARATIPGVFSSISYADLQFAIFAGLLWVAMILSLIYIKVKGNKIVKGVLLRIGSSAITYYLTVLLTSNGLV